MLASCSLVLTLLASPPLAITHLNIVVPGSRTILRDQTVLIQDGKITQVGPNLAIPATAQTVEGKDRWAIPGLWDMHVHLFDDRGLKLMVANGVTGARVMWGSPVHLGWRKRIDSGQMLGPRLKLAGAIVDGPKPIWPGTIAVKTPEDGRRAVRLIKNDGYDFVKVYSLLGAASYRAIAAEAKAEKIDFEGHVPYSISLAEAAELGQRSSEHLMGFSVEASSEGDSIRRKLEKIGEEGFAKVADSSKDVFALAKKTATPASWERVIRQAARSPMWQCPTLAVLRAISYLDDPQFRDDPRLKYVSPMISASWNPKTDFRLKNRSEADWKEAKTGFKRNLDLFTQLYRQGAKMLAGTDCLNPYVFPGFSLHDELALMVQAGMTPTDALACATTYPAEFLREGHRGQIAQGEPADLVLLQADPTVDIHNTTKIAAVVRAGRYLDRAELDALLASCAYPPARKADQPTGWCIDP